MPATITRGYTFGATELVTNTKLHNLVDNATISGIDATNLASGSGLIIRSTSAPSNTNAIWVDTNQTPPTAKVWTGSEWQPVGPYAVLTNKSGSQRTAGEVVIPSTTTDGSFNTTTTADVPALGVVLETIADNADGVVALPGARITSLVTAATVTRGQTLSTSTTAGKGTPGGVNAYAVALSAGTGATTITEALVISPSLIPAAGAGTTGQFLKTLGAGTVPLFVNLLGGLIDPSTLIIKAVKFDGSGSNGAVTPTSTLGGSHTVVKNGTGDYTVTWANAFSSADYFMAGMVKDSDSSTAVPTVAVKGSATNPSTTAVTFKVSNDGSTARNATQILIIAIGT